MLHTQRHGQLAATNMLGILTRFIDVPISWAEQCRPEFRAVGWTANHEPAAIQGAVREREFGIHRSRQGAMIGEVTCSRDVALPEDPARAQGYLGERRTPALIGVGARGMLAMRDLNANGFRSWPETEEHP